MLKTHTTIGLAALNAAPDDIIFQLIGDSVALYVVAQHVTIAAYRDGRRVDVPTHVG